MRGQAHMHRNSKPPAAGFLLRNGNMKYFPNSIKYIGASCADYWLLRELEGRPLPNEPGVYVATATVTPPNHGAGTVVIRFAGHTDHLDQVWSHLPKALHSTGLSWTVDYSDSVDLMDPFVREDWATDLQGGIALHLFAA